LRGFADGSIDVAIMDPPYSERQHLGVRSSGRNRGLADGNGRTSACATRRTVDLGFDHFTRSDCQRLCHEAARIVRRWTLVFCDDELLPIWRACARKAGLDVIRTGVWVRIGGAPQFTGDRPAGGAEYVVILHPKGRKRWNGGGDPAVWSHAIVANRSRHRNDRVHTTQKPIGLLLDLVGMFSEPGESILDPFAGSGTTGMAALRLGRSFIGIERMAEHYETARGRLEREDGEVLPGSAYRRHKQMSLLETTGGTR
jgi:site-specific DNA-methyltransferase (adenine-specific)